MNKKNQKYITIRLKPEEASIFRRAYANRKVELENELDLCESPSDVHIITEKIKRIKEEIRVFEFYN